MMKEHCMIGGKRCSKCCEVLTIGDNKNFREWRAYTRRWGVTEDQPEIGRISKMIQRVSKRRAKKINPGMVASVGGQQAYWTCKNYKQGECSAYAERPMMCSKYPLYGRTAQDWAENLRAGEKLIGLYRDDCTYYDPSYFIEVK